MPFTQWLIDEWFDILCERAHLPEFLAVILLVFLPPLFWFALVYHLASLQWAILAFIVTLFLWFLALTLAAIRTDE